MKKQLFIHSRSLANRWGLFVYIQVHNHMCVYVYVCVYNTYICIYEDKYLRTWDLESCRTYLNQVCLTPKLKLLFMMREI